MTSYEGVKWALERDLTRLFWAVALIAGCGLIGGFLFSLWLVARVVRWAL